jgi:hypothetical protein
VVHAAGVFGQSKRAAQFLLDEAALERGLAGRLGAAIFVGGGQTPAANPIENARQLVGVEPNAVALADIDDHVAPMCEVLPHHERMTDWARNVAMMPGCRALAGRASRVDVGRVAMVGAFALLTGLLDQLPKRLSSDPNPGARLAFEHRAAVDHAAVQSPALATSGTGQRSLFDVERLGGQGVAAVVAELGVIADSGEAVWADRVEVALAEREIGAAKAALGRPVASRRSTRGAAHYGGIMPLRPGDCHDLSASAAKPRSDEPTGGVVLPMAGRASDEEAHGKGGRRSEAIALTKPVYPRPKWKSRNVGRRVLGEDERDRGCCVS